MGGVLCKGGYEANKNLFAFNYPNQDFAIKNSEKLEEYIEAVKIYSKVNSSPYNSSVNSDFKAEASDIFATKNDLDKNQARFILIGHSNGGLVSRYYIENMGGDVNVDKLITIDTPHYGSNLANMAYSSLQRGLEFDNMSVIVPLDFELRPASSLFTGDFANMDEYILKYMGNPVSALALSLYANSEKFTYIQENQSFKLMGNSRVNTEYYAIGGAVSRYDEAPFADMVYNFEFEMDDLSSAKDFQGRINNALKDEYGIEIKHMIPLVSDNVVELYSQFGLKVDGDSITEHIEFEKTSIFLAFKPPFHEYWVLNHFHGDILNNRQMQRTVLKYIRD